MSNKTADLVATWEVPLYDRTHKIEFEHGTTTGRRVVKVDGEVIIKKDWMFKLVGCEPFQIKGQNGDTYAKCEILINACSGFTYEYILNVNGKQFKTFREKQSRIMRTWHWEMDGKEWRVVLEKDTLDIWVNGQKKETTHEFADEGTEMTFQLDSDLRGCIKTASSGNRRQGMVYQLLVNGTLIEESSS